MDSIGLLVGGIVGLLLQYLIVLYAIRNGLERERKTQQLQTQLLILIGEKNGATTEEIEQVINNG